MYLLGIGNGHIYDRCIKLDSEGEVKGGADAEFKFNGTLEAYISERYYIALKSFNAPFPENTTEDDRRALLAEREADVTRVEEAIGYAKTLQIELVDELSKGKKSKLRLDQSRTDETGVEHITLKSLLEWYESLSKKLKKGQIESLEAFSNARQPSEMSKPERSLYVSLALCSEALAEKLKNASLHDGDWNVLKVAEALHSQGCLATTDENGLDSQSVASLRVRLALAKRCKAYLS